jgi:hypothetical protein
VTPGTSASHSVNEPAPFSFVRSTQTFRDLRDLHAHNRHLRYAALAGREDPRALELQVRARVGDDDAARERRRERVDVALALGGVPERVAVDVIVQLRGV